MSIEPTEEHRRAAVMHHYKYAVLPDKGYLTDWVRTGDATGRSAFDEVVRLARLLAEREAKLQERYDASVAYYKAQADAYHLDVKQLHAHLDTARAHERTFKADLDNALGINDTLRARVAELEASEPNVLLQRAYSLACNERNALAEREAQHLARIAEMEAKAANLDARLWDRCEDLARVGLERVHADAVHSKREAQHLARIAELEAEVSESTRLRMTETLHGMGVEAMYQEREAQHLADIKALREALGQGYALSLNAREQVLKATAHYDDAKADAPAVVSVRCAHCGPVAPEHFRDHDVVHTEGGEG